MKTSVSMDLRQFRHFRVILCMVSLFTMDTAQAQTDTWRAASLEDMGLTGVIQRLGTLDSKPCVLVMEGSGTDITLTLSTLERIDGPAQYIWTSESNPPLDDSPGFQLESTGETLWLVCDWGIFAISADESQSYNHCLDPQRHSVLITTTGKAIVAAGYRKEESSGQDSVLYRTFSRYENNECREFRKHAITIGSLVPRSLVENATGAQLLTFHSSSLSYSIGDVEGRSITIQGFNESEACRLEALWGTSGDGWVLVALPKDAGNDGYILEMNEAYHVVSIVALPLGGKPVRRARFDGQYVTVTADNGVYLYDYVRHSFSFFPKDEMLRTSGADNVGFLVDARVAGGQLWVSTPSHVLALEGSVSVEVESPAPVKPQRYRVYSGRDPLILPTCPGSTNDHVDVLSVDGSLLRLTVTDEGEAMRVDLDQLVPGAYAVRSPCGFEVILLMP